MTTDGLLTGVHSRQWFRFKWKILNISPQNYLVMVPPPGPSGGGDTWADLATPRHGSMVPGARPRHLRVSALRAAPAALVTRPGLLSLYNHAAAEVCYRFHPEITQTTTQQQQQQPR